jgi:DNA-binding response OmpR family regulator
MKSILLIEPDRHRAAEFQAVVANRARRVTVADGIDAALLTITMDPPDVIVVSPPPKEKTKPNAKADRQPPQGVATVKHLRSTHRFSGAILVLTDSTERLDQLDFYKAGADDLCPRWSGLTYMVERLSFWFDNTKNSLEAFERRREAIDALLDPKARL